jgi:RNA polymerase sigma factor (sigma-70 family)
VTDEPSDAELLARIQTDPVALELIFRRYRHLVLRYAARRCSDPADVVDLVADTFLALLESGGGGFDPRRGSAAAWILGVAHRQWVRTVRRETRIRQVAGRHGGQRQLDADDMARIEEQIDASRQQAAVEEAMAQLPDRHREVLWLIGHEGLSSEQAAAVTGVRPAVFRVRLHRARRALQHQLDTRTAERPDPRVLPATEVTR